jgi:hypothetical protein
LLVGLEMNEKSILAARFCKLDQGKMFPISDAKEAFASENTKRVAKVSKQQQLDILSRA